MAEWYENKAGVADIISNMKGTSSLKGIVDNLVQDVNTLEQQVQNFVLKEVNTIDGVSSVINDASGAGVTYLDDDKSKSYVGVNGEGAAMFAVGEDNNGIVLSVTPDGAYIYNRDATPSDGKRIVTKSMLDATYGALTGSNSDQIINTFDEIKAFLASIGEDKTLTGMLSEYAKSSSVEELSSKVDTLATKEELNKRVVADIVSDKGTAKIFNEETGGGSMFDGTSVKSFIGVNDGTSDVYGQLYVKGSTDNDGTRLNLTKDGFYYFKGSNSVPENKDKAELATSGDISEVKDLISKKVDSSSTGANGTSLIFNEGDGGGIKFTKTGNDLTAYVGVHDGSGNDTDFYPNMYVKLDGKTYRLYGKGDGFYYKPDGKEASEIAVKDDFKEYSKSELAGVEDGDKAYNDNDETGGSIRYVRKAGDTAIVSVDGIDGHLFAQMVYKDHDTHEANRTGFIIDKTGAFYLKNKGGIETEPKNEVATLDDVDKRVEKELKSDRGTAKIFNESDGGGAMFTTTTGDVSFVGVNDGTNDIGAQLYVRSQDGSTYAMLTAKKSGIHYKKSGSTNEDDELITVGEVKKLINALKEELKKENGSSSVPSENQ